MNILTISDFLYFLLEPSTQYISIFNINNGKEIFNGWADDIDREFGDLEICSIDSVHEDTITLNISR